MRDSDIKQPNLAKALMKRNLMNNYNIWIFNKISEFLGSRVLDIGSGAGNVIAEMSNGHRRIIATDIFDEKIEIMKDRFKQDQNVVVTKFNIVEGQIDIFIEEKIDTVTGINVLEHIADDLAALDNMKSVLISGGKIVLLVPAFQLLYGAMDLASGHYKRYQPGELATLAKNLDLKIKFNGYMNFIGMIPWFFSGKLLNKKKPYSESLGESKISVYNKIIPYLEYIEGKVTVPVGLSEIIVLEKS